MLAWHHKVVEFVSKNNQLVQIQIHFSYVQTDSVNTDGVCSGNVGVRVMDPIRDYFYLILYPKVHTSPGVPL